MRAEKSAILEEVRSRLSGSSFVVVANYHGMNVEQTETVRARLRPCKSEFHVVANTWLKRAAADLGWGAIEESALGGPTAVVYGVGDAADLVKRFQALRQEVNVLAIKGGFMEGKFLTAQEVDALGKLPSKVALYGMLVGAVAAPMSGLMGVLKQKLCSLLYVLKAIEEKKGDSLQQA